MSNLSAFVFRIPHRVFQRVIKLLDVHIRIVCPPPSTAAPPVDLRRSGIGARSTSIVPHTLAASVERIISGTGACHAAQRRLEQRHDQRRRDRDYPHRRRRSWGLPPGLRQYGQVPMQHSGYEFTPKFLKKP